MVNLVSIEGYTIGYNGAEFTPLDYMLSSNPKKAIMPLGFRDLLRSECPRAWFELCNGGTVCGFKFRNIIEISFEQQKQINKLKGF